MLVAAAAGLAIGVSLSAVVGGLEAFRPVAGRLAMLRAASGAAVIDDSYNANPDSVRAAIDVLAGAPEPATATASELPTCTAAPCVPEIAPLRSAGALRTSSAMGSVARPAERRVGNACGVAFARRRDCRGRWSNGDAKRESMESTQ